MSWRPSLNQLQIKIFGLPLRKNAPKDTAANLTDAIDMGEGTGEWKLMGLLEEYPRQGLYVTMKIVLVFSSMGLSFVSNLVNFTVYPLES